MEKQSSRSPRQVNALKIAAIAAILLAAGLFWISILAYPALRPFADRLAADGSLDSLTPRIYNLIQYGLRFLALCFFSAGIVSFILPNQALMVWQSIIQEKRSAILGWPRDTAAAFRELPGRLLRKNILVPLGILTGFALLARFLYINDPMRHDEAYSFVIFAKLPLRLAIADYHFPNNHVFHTLLMHLSQRWFGDSPLAVRLPALSAGIALVPAGYLFARRLYGNPIAWTAGAALAAAPVLIHYSTNARGYSLLALCTILVFLLAVELTRRSNLFYWSLAALVSAVGFYTLPIFLMPFGIILTWLILAGLNKKTIPPGSRSSWFIRLGIFTLSTLLFTALLYLPAFRYSGVESVISNPYVESLGWKDFWPTLVSRLQETGVEWTLKVPPLVTILTIIGCGISIVLHNRISRQKISTQLAAFAFIPLILLVQRPNAWSKIWQFLFPLVLIWAAAGLVGGLGWIQKRIKLKIPLPVLGAGVITAGLVGMAAVNALRDHPGLQPVTGRVEQAAQYLKENLREDDIVVIAPIDDAPLWYYFYKYELSQDYFRKDIPFRKAYILISRDQDQTIEEVLAVRGPDQGFLDLKTTVLLDTWNDLDLFSIDADWQAVSKAYNLSSP